MPQRCSKREHTAWAFSNALPLWCSDISNVAGLLSHLASHRLASDPTSGCSGRCYRISMFHLGQSSGHFFNPAQIPVCELCSASSGSGWGGQRCIGGDSRHAPSRHFQAASGPSPWNPDWNPRGIDRPRWKDRDTIGAGADALPSLSSAPLLVGRDSVAITRVQIYQITRWVCKSISLEARCMVIMCSSVPLVVS